VDEETDGVAMATVHRSRRAAETDGGTYTVTNRFEVYDDSQDNQRSRGTAP